MAMFTYYDIPSSKLSEIEYKFGNLIYVEDLHRIYLDGVYGRVCYDSIVTFDTDADRIAQEHPFEGFYFVEENKMLWRYYDEEWTPISGSSSNVIFVTELPERGEEDILYVCGTTMYSWSDTSEEFVPMNSSETIWNEI